MTPQQKAEWAQRRQRIRAGMTHILSCIEAGELTEHQFGQLNNFVLTMCWLLSKVQPGTLDASLKEVEAAAWLTGGMDDRWDIVMDENTQRASKLGDDVKIQEELK